MGSNSEIPYRDLGRTGERVSCIGVGGWHLALPDVTEKLATRIVRTAVDRGINFMDNSWDITRGRARSGWARRSATVIATRSS